MKNVAFLLCSFLSVSVSTPCLASFQGCEETNTPTHTKVIRKDYYNSYDQIFKVVKHAKSEVSLASIDPTPMPCPPKPSSIDPKPNLKALNDSKAKMNKSAA
ncbi:MAG: hypothetical protein ACK5O7_03250 [Holosporales bacterium]